MGIVVMWFVFAAVFGLVGVLLVLDTQKTGFICMTFCIICAAVATVVQLYAPEAAIDTEFLEAP